MLNFRYETKPLDVATRFGSTEACNSFSLSQIAIRHLSGTHRTHAAMRRHHHIHAPPPPPHSPHPTPHPHHHNGRCHHHDCHHQHHHIILIWCQFHLEEGRGSSCGRMHTRTLVRTTDRTKGRTKLRAYGKKTQRVGQQEGQS